MLDEANGNVTVRGVEVPTLYEDKLMFVPLAARDGEINWLTSDELRELANEIDTLEGVG